VLTPRIGTNRRLAQAFKSPGYDCPPNEGLANFNSPTSLPYVTCMLLSLVVDSHNGFTSSLSNTTHRTLLILRTTMSKLSPEHTMTLGGRYRPSQRVPQRTKKWCVSQGPKLRIDQNPQPLCKAGTSDQ
jgi:hypothetical protein